MLEQHAHPLRINTNYSGFWVLTYFLKFPKSYYDQMNLITGYFTYTHLVNVMQQTVKGKVCRIFSLPLVMVLYVATELQACLSELFFL